QRCAYHQHADRLITRYDRYAALHALARQTLPDGIWCIGRQNVAASIDQHDLLRLRLQIFGRSILRPLIGKLTLGIRSAVARLAGRRPVRRLVGQSDELGKYLAHAVPRMMLVVVSCEARRELVRLPLA